MKARVWGAASVLAATLLVPFRLQAQTSTDVSGDRDVPQPALASPGAVETPPASDDDALSSAELADLDLSMEAGETVAPDNSLELYGFVDFGTMFVLWNRRWREAVQPHSSFFIGNFNIYVSKRITEDFRMFSEVRLTYLPNGTTSSALADGEVISTSTIDYADFQRPMKWGGIEIERVYLEWIATPWLTLRVGQFLTPYGVWNVDHGSPAVIPVARPFVIGQQLFPEYRDLDDNKALGARAYWSYEGLGQLTIGVSGFYGSDTDARSVAGLDAQGDMLTHPLTGTRFALADTFDYGGYLLAGYRFGWFGVMPYVVLSHIEYLETASNTRPRPYSINVGLNIRPLDEAALAGAVTYGRKIHSLSDGSRSPAWSLLSCGGAAPLF